MKKNLFLALFLGASVLLSAQEKAIVYFKSKPVEGIHEQVDAETLQSLDKLGIEVKGVSKWLNAAKVAGFNLESLLLLENVRGYISYAGVNIGGDNMAGLEVKDLGKSDVDSLKNLKMHNYKFMQQVDALGGKGVKLAIFDGGFDVVDKSEWAKHLHDNGKILETKNFVNGGDQVYQSSSHGSRVLSVIAGTPGEYVGSAPNADFYLVVTEDAANERLEEEFNWAMGVEWAFEKGVKVINSSLGYTEFDEKDENHVYGDLDGETTPAAKAAVLAARNGILVVNSVGNSGSLTWRVLGTPADADSILAVGAVDENRNSAFFTSHGPAADGRVKPEVTGLGVQTLTNYKDKVAGANGTSFSSPVMAGIAARLWALFPEANNMLIREALIKASDRYAFPDTLYGYGIPNFELAYRYLSNTVKEDSVVLFPNPVSTDLNIAGKRLNNLSSIQIVNTIGQQVLEYTVQGKSIKKDLSWLTTGLHAGNYKLVLLYDDGKKEVLPFNKL